MVKTKNCTIVFRHNRQLKIERNNEKKILPSISETTQQLGKWSVTSPMRNFFSTAQLAITWLWLEECRTDTSIFWESNSFTMLNADRVTYVFSKITITRRLLSIKHSAGKASIAQFCFLKNGTELVDQRLSDYQSTPGTLLPPAPGTGTTLSSTSASFWWRMLVLLTLVIFTDLENLQKYFVSTTAHTRWWIWQRYGGASLQWACSHTTSVIGLRHTEFRCLHTDPTDATSLQKKKKEREEFFQGTLPPSAL